MILYGLNLELEQLRYGKGRERPRNRAGRQVANERAMRDAISGLAALSQVQLLTVQGKAYGKGKFQ